MICKILGYGTKLAKKVIWYHNLQRIDNVQEQVSTLADTIQREGEHRFETDNGDWEDLARQIELLCLRIQGIVNTGHVGDTEDEEES